MPPKKVTRARLRSMLGGAVHVQTCRLVAERMLQGMGWREGEAVRWADMASGLGTTAAAVQAAAGAGFEYVVAAEREADTARVHAAAWGTPNEGEATTANWTAWAGKVDAVGITPDCGRFSKRARRSAADTAGRVEEAMKELRAMAEGAEAMRPRAVMVESVGDLLEGENEETGERMEEVLRQAMPEMAWRAQVLDAHKHGAAAMARSRAFWVGVRGGWVGGESDGGEGDGGSDGSGSGGGDGDSGRGESGGGDGRGSGRGGSNSRRGDGDGDGGGGGGDAERTNDSGGRSGGDDASGESGAGRGRNGSARRKRKQGETE